MKPAPGAKKVGDRCEEPCLLFLCEVGMSGNFKKEQIGRASLVAPW